MTFGSILHRRPVRPDSRFLFRSLFTIFEINPIILLLGYTNSNTDIDTGKRKFNSYSRYLNPKVGTIIMTCPTSFFHETLKHSEFESYRWSSHHGLFHFCSEIFKYLEYKLNFLFPVSISVLEFV